MIYRLSKNVQFFHLFKSYEASYDLKQLEEGIIFGNVRWFVCIRKKRRDYFWRSRMICWLSNNLGAGREKVEASDLQFFQLWDLFSKYFSSKILFERYTRKWKFLHLTKGKSQGVKCQSSQGQQNSFFFCNFDTWPSNFQPVQSCEAIQMGRLKVLDNLGPCLVCLGWGPSSFPNTGFVLS